jgi:putative addiction module killer protein
MKVLRTDTFVKWVNRLKDDQAAARIAVRIERAKLGNLGDVKPVGDGVYEMRISCGPGYRLYFIQCGNELIILLAGGDKSSQARDIRKAKQLAQEVTRENYETSRN